jgi:hypothetical protein
LIDCRIDFPQGFFDVEHIVFETETHQIKTEPVGEIVLCPDLQAVEHELEEHAML